MPTVKSSPVLWWIAAALGPVWYQIYGALLVLPAPPKAVQLLAPLAPLHPLIGIGFALAWGAAVVMVTSLLGWALLKNLRTRQYPSSVAALRLSLSAALAVMLLSWVSPLIAQPLWALRRFGIEACIAKADRVVEALEQHRREYGTYPKSLQELVPQYFAAIPSPSAIGYPTFMYVRADAAAKDGAYELAIPMPHGGSGDRLFYRPNRDYPDMIYSGKVDRVGGWAYVRE